ncbi:7720_t:CDS:2, partial [Acaulospora morrowiae]
SSNMIDEKGATVSKDLVQSFHPEPNKIENGTAHKKMDEYMEVDCDDDTATIASEDPVESRNNDFDEIFNGELSDVDSYCPGCEEIDHEDLLSSAPIPSVDVSHLVGFTKLNKKIIESLIYKLKEYKLYETMAILIKSGKLKIKSEEIPRRVLEIIKQEDIKDLKDVKEVFHKEAERIRRLAEDK